MRDTKRLLLRAAVMILIPLLVIGCSTGPSTSGPTTLTVWTWKVAHVAGLQAVGKDFEAKTGIKVNVTAINPDDVYKTKLTTAAQSGDLPDILSYWTGGNDFWNLAGSGTLIQITDKMDSDWKSQFLNGTLDKSSYFSQSRQSECQKDSRCTFTNVKAGQLFSVPYMAGSAYFVYGNKALLKQAGIDADTAPKSAEDWMEMMKAVKSKTGKAGVVAGAKNQDVPVRWLYNPLLMTSCGQEKFDAIWSGKASFQDPCSLRVFSYIAQIASQKLWTPDVLATDIDPADVAFSQGKAGFDIGGTYTLSFLLAQGMKSDDILAFAVPPLKGSVYDHLAVGVDGLIEAAVTKDSKHRDDSVRFLKFLSSSDEGAVFARTVGDLPAVKIPTDPAKVGAAMVGLIRGLDPANAPFAKSTTVDHLPDNTFNVVKLGLAQLISGETTPAAVAGAADKASHS